MRLQLRADPDELQKVRLVEIGVGRTPQLASNGVVDRYLRHLGAACDMHSTVSNTHPMDSAFGGHQSGDESRAAGAPHLSMDTHVGAHGRSVQPSLRVSDIPRIEVDAGEEASQRKCSTVCAARQPPDPVGQGEDDILAPQRVASSGDGDTILVLIAHKPNVGGDRSGK